MTELKKSDTPFLLGLPKGRMASGVLRLLGDAGIIVKASERGYRPSISLENTAAKTMKPQNIIEMLSHGRRDAGFAGADWVEELNADVVEVLDTGLDRVQLIAAIPQELASNGGLPKRRIVVSSEYERIARRWIKEQSIDAEFVHSYGATEVFPPEDADLIIDNVATGATLRANGLVVFDTIMQSSTRLLASRAAMRDPAKRERINGLRLLLESVLEARSRVMIEINASRETLDTLVSLLPCMREATVAPLFGDSGFAIRAAVPRQNLPGLLPALKEAGGTDIVVSSIAQIVP